MAQERALFSYAQFSEGITNVSAWVHHQAATIKADEGFGWTLDEERTPLTYAQLVQTYQATRASGEPYPVAETGSATALYGAETNAAFRFVHDITHARLQQDFTAAGELIVAIAHLNSLSEHYPFGGLEWQLLFADTVGQLVFGNRHNRFVEDQTDFAQQLVLKGIESAVRRGAQRLFPAQSVDGIDAGGAPGGEVGDN